MLAVLLIAATVSLQKQLEALSANDPNWPFHPTYVVLQRGVIAAAVMRNDEDGQPIGSIVVYRVHNGRLGKPLASYGRFGRPAVTGRDLDGDGRPDLIVTDSPGNRSTPHTYLRWEGRSLKLMGGSGTPRFVDLDHDGVDEIITGMIKCGQSPDCDGMTACRFVQRIRNHRFVDDETNYGDFMEMRKTDGEPQDFQGGFTLAGEWPRHAVFHIINGRRGGGHRATALTMRIDGERIPVSLDRTVEFREVAVDLRSHCGTTDVTIEGPLNAEVMILMEVKP